MYLPSLFTQDNPIFVHYIEGNTTKRWPSFKIPKVTQFYKLTLFEIIHFQIYFSKYCDVVIRELGIAESYKSWQVQ